MLDTDDLALWCALNRLMADYWADVDENGGDRAHVYYMPDAHYVVGTNHFVGGEKIRAFYARRRHSKIVTRHLISNLRVFQDDAEHARVVGMMSLYRGHGDSAYQGARPPSMIADFEARCVLGNDHVWRFQSHVLRPFIIGSDLPASVSVNPRGL